MVQQLLIRRTRVPSLTITTWRHRVCDVGFRAFFTVTFSAIALLLNLSFGATASTCSQNLHDQNADFAAVRSATVDFIREFPRLPENKRVSLFGRTLATLSGIAGLHPEWVLWSLDDVRRTLVESLFEPELKWYRKQVFHFLEKDLRGRDVALLRSIERFRNEPFEKLRFETPDELESLREAIRSAHQVEGRRRLAYVLQTQFARLTKNTAFGIAQLPRLISLSEASVDLFFDVAITLKRSLNDHAEVLGSYSFLRLSAELDAVVMQPFQSPKDASEKQFSQLPIAHSRLQHYMQTPWIAIQTNSSYSLN